MTSPTVDLPFVNDAYYLDASLITIPIDDLKDQKVHVLGNDYEGIFSMDVWSHPTLPGIVTIRATARNFNHSQIETFRMHFDQDRASHLKRVEHEEYKFEADFRGLALQRRNCEIEEIVRAEFQEATKHLVVGEV